MGLTTRQAAKRKLDQAIGNLDWASAHLQDVGETYAEAHPEISQPLADVILLIEQVQELIRKIDKGI